MAISQHGAYGKRQHEKNSTIQEEPIMKEYDRVRLINDRERYTKRGIVKGMVGTILDPRCIEGRWLVIFSDPITGDDIADDSIKEEDLEVVPEA